MNAATDNCPKCGSNLTRSHCTSPTCDLLRCLRCDGIGTRTGRRWRTKQPKEDLEP